MEEKRMEMKNMRKQKRYAAWVCKMLLIAVIVFFGGRILITQMGDMTGSSVGVGMERDSSAGDPAEADAGTAEKPIRRSGAELKSKLNELAGKYPEIAKICENQSQYSEKLLSILANNPEMADFVENYNTAAHKTQGATLTEKEKKAFIPLFIQWDKRWGYVYYGDNVLGLSGCAPTCLAMVITGLTGTKDATPDKVASYATRNGYYVKENGTSWSIMTEGSRALGVTGREISLAQSVVSRELEQGHPIICSVGPGDFTTSGHFIVLVRYRNGKIKVNDPNCRARSRWWDYSELEGQIRNLWAFEKG